MLIDLYELAYSAALEHVAAGNTRDEARDDLLGSWHQLEPDAVTDILADALYDARKQGVEREDIDESWF